MQTCCFRLKIATAALAMLPIAVSPASAAERGRGVAGKNGGAIVCLAGCDSAPPVVVGRAPMTPARPLSQPTSQEDVSYRMRNVWCGNGGSCVAVNHIAPPRLRDSYDPSIAVFHYHRW